MNVNVLRSEYEFRARLLSDEAKERMRDVFSRFLISPAVAVSTSNVSCNVLLPQRRENVGRHDDVDGGLPHAGGR